MLLWRSCRAENSGQASATARAATGREHAVLRLNKTASPADELELDKIDEALLAGVDAGLPWRRVVSAVACAPEEAQARLLRLMHLGIVEDDSVDRESSERDACAEDDPFDSQPTGLLEPPPPSTPRMRPV